MSNYGDEINEGAYDEGEEDEREDEDSFNRPADEDFDDVEPDDFDSEMKDEGANANGGTFSSSSSSHSLAFEPTLVRKDYEALDETALRGHMETLIADVASVIDESKDKAALLLRTQKWNKEKLIAEYFEDPQQMLRKVGMEHFDEADDANGPRVPSSDDFTCLICDDEVAITDTYSLGDGHRFCNSCWRDYLTSSFFEGRAVLSTVCPAYQCPNLCLPSTFQLLCSPSDFKRYSSYVLRSYVEDNVSMRWCTSPSCPYALHAFNRGVQSVICPLGHSFCWRCQEEAHEPCSCAQLVAWKEKCSLESDNAHWIIANTKRCPQCTVRIEKNQGCNHITCRSCKFEWCWVCNGSWVDHGNHTGGFYKCNKVNHTDTQITYTVTRPLPFPPSAAALPLTILSLLFFLPQYDPKAGGKTSKWKVEAAADTSERKEGSAPSSSSKSSTEKSAETLRSEKDAELNRYLFYYQRYHNHAESAKFASQLRKETEKKMALVAAGGQKTATTSPHGEALLIDYAFLQQATDVILTCRHVLKYTYVFAYFLVGEEREGERNLFEFLQQQLEKSVEALSELTEQKVEVLGKKEEKSKIVNYTRITDKFRENLLTGVRNGLTG